MREKTTSRVRLKATARDDLIVGISFRYKVTIAVVWTGIWLRIIYQTHVKSNQLTVRVIGPININAISGNSELAMVSVGCMDMVPRSLLRRSSRAVFVYLCKVDSNL